MSKERELLREIMGYVASGVVSITSNDLGDAAETLHEIQELLAQPEQEPISDDYTKLKGDYKYYISQKSQKREPLSDEDVFRLYEESEYLGFLAYRKGIKDAEKAHGIGGGE